MYKGFFEDVEYVMGLFFKPFEDCFKDAPDEDDFDGEDEDMADDAMPEEVPADDLPAALKMGKPVLDIMKCLFNASDIDYDYED